MQRASRVGERAMPRRVADTVLPAPIGSAEFQALGGMIAVRCPRDLAPLMHQAGDLWAGQSPLAD